MPTSMPTPSPNADENAARYFLALGAAAADLWSDLPQDLQHVLFERAVCSAIRASATRACASNWPNSCTIITSARNRGE